MENEVKVINSAMAVDDDTFAPFVVVTLAIPMKPSDDVDINEKRQELANDIVSALVTYTEENPPKEYGKALPLSEYTKQEDTTDVGK